MCTVVHDNGVERGPHIGAVHARIRERPAHAGHEAVLGLGAQPPGVERLEADLGPVGDDGAVVPRGLDLRDNVAR